MKRVNRRDQVVERRVVLPIWVGQDCEEVGREIGWVRVHCNSVGKRSNGGKGLVEV